MQTSNRLEAKYNLSVNLNMSGHYAWSIRNPENLNDYSGSQRTYEAAYVAAMAKVHALENAPTPTLPNGERI